MTISTFFQGAQNVTLETKDQRGEFADTTQVRPVEPEPEPEEE